MVCLNSLELDIAGFVRKDNCHCGSCSYDSDTLLGKIKLYLPEFE